MKDWSAISFLSIVEKKLQLPAIAHALNSALATNTNQQINWINPHTNNLYSVYFNVFDNGICIQCTNITESSALHYWDLLNLLPSAVVIADAATGKFQFANREFCNLIGYLPAEIPSTSITNIHLPEDLAKITDVFDKMAKGIVNTATDIRVVQKNGHIIWVDIYAFKAKHYNQELVFGVFTDNTQKHLEKQQLINALQTAEHNQVLFQQVQTIAAIGHIQKNWITNNIECSKEVFDILEIDANKTTVSNEVLIACVHPDDRVKLLNEFEKHLALKLEFNFVHRIQTPDNKTKYIQQKAITHFNEKGEPIKSVGIFADITHAKLAEISLLEKIAEAEAAKEKAKRVKTIMELTLEQAVDAVITINSNGKIIFVNLAACLLFGYSKDELMGENVNMLIKNEHHFKHNTYIKNHLDTQENKIVGSGIELQLTNKAGKQFWGQLTLSKVYYLGETQFTAFIKDISLQKKTAEELAVREKRFQELALHSRSVTWEVDANGLYTYVSEAAATVYGYNANELINKFHFYDLHPANGREAFKKAAFKVFEKKENFYNLTNAIQCKNGSVIWVNTNGIPMLNEQGELIGYRGSDTDITQKMLAENELHLLKQAIEASSVSFTLADATLPDMPLIYVNEAFVELTGYSKEEVLGKNCRFLHKNNEEELVLSIIKKGIEEGKNTSVTIKNYRKNGELFWNQLTISPIYNRDGILSHFVGVQKDITDRIDYFQAMMRQNQQLKEIAWMQSHVVRAPLSRMMGLIQLLDYNNFDNVEEDDLLKTPADVLKEIMNAAFELDAIIKRISEKTYEQEKMSQLA